MRSAAGEEGSTTAKPNAPAMHPAGACHPQSAVVAHRASSLGNGARPIEINVERAILMAANVVYLAHGRLHPVRLRIAQSDGVTMPPSGSKGLVPPLICS
jgi:hypothetical protein